LPATLDVVLLGGFRVTCRGEAVASLDTPRLQSLFAYLALHGDPGVSRGHLAGLFWPDSPEGQARANLRKLLWELRRRMPAAAEFFTLDDPVLRWRPQATRRVDALEFARLARAEEPAAVEAAVGLYRGDLLPGLSDDWILAARESLRAECGRALRRLIQLHESRRAYARAAEYAATLVRLDPGDEAAWQALLRLQALQGNVAGLERAYRRCVQALWSEVGAGPGPQTRQLYAALRRGVARAAARGPDPLPLVDRQQEWQLLRQAWEAARAGEARCVLVVGLPGEGKTRLVREFAAWVDRQGYAAAYARCHPLEGQTPFGLARAWLGAAGGGDPPRLPAGGRRGRAGLFAALDRVLLAVQPRLLIADDLHASDPDSLPWLASLLTAHPRAALLVVATVRPDDLRDHPTLEAFLRTLAAAGRLTRLELQPLDLAATGELAALALGGPLPPHTVERLHRQTGGNPLFVLELLRHRPPGEEAGGEQPWPLPATIQALLSVRLGRLAPTDRHVALFASAHDGPLSLPLLRRLTLLEEAELVRAVDELCRLRLWRPVGPDRFQFAHDAVREVAYAELGAARRLLAHRRLAEALAEGGEGADADWSARLAFHWERAGVPERAAACYRRAAEAAERMYAYAAATAFWRKLLDLTPPDSRAEVWCRLGELHRSAGRFADAEHAFRQGLSLALGSGDARAEAACRLHLGRLLLFLRADGEALAHLDRARALWGRWDVPAAEGETLWLMGLGHRFSGDHARALGHLRQAARRLAAAGRADLLGDVAGEIGTVHFTEGQTLRALAAWRLQAVWAERAGQRVGLLRALGRMGLGYRRLGDAALAWCCFSAGLQLGLEAATRRVPGAPDDAPGVLYWDFAGLPWCPHARDEEEQLALKLGPAWAAAVFAGLAAELCLEGGRWGQAEELLEAALTLEGTLRLPYHRPKYLQQKARLALARGRRPEAARLNEEALRLAGRTGREDVVVAAGALAARLAEPAAPDGAGPSPSVEPGERRTRDLAARLAPPQTREVGDLSAELLRRRLDELLRALPT
jgi:DNA-binding SARP family transcriptional activator